MKILGYHITPNLIASSEGEARTEPPFLDWLLERAGPDTISCLYHLDYNVACLLKMIGLTEKEYKILHSRGRLYISPYTLKYIPSKFFSIDWGGGRGHPYIIFSNMAQYAETRLESVGYVGEIPDARPCLERARESERTGRGVYDSLASLGLYPISLVSPIRAYQKEVLDKLDLPTVDDIPEEAGEYAYECCKGSWLEAFQRGYWEETWDYDISSSYPYQLSRLPDIRQGSWSEGDYIPESARLGYARGRVTITSRFSPILYKKTRDLSYTPTGNWLDCLTLAEIRFIEIHKLGSFEIDWGHWWIPRYTVTRQPLHNIIERLYEEKEKSEGLRREVIKRIMAGIYGKLLEVRQYGEQEMGPLFNPVWGAEVETNTRLAMAELALSEGLYPIHVAVDGLLSGRELPISNSGAMGSWKLAAHSPALVSGSGVVAIKDRVGVGDFSLDYDWLMERIKEEPGARCFEMRKISPVTLSKAVNLNKLDKLGELEETIRTVDLGYEVKRAYPELVSTGGELIKSQVEGEPWDISLLQGVTP